MNKKNTEYRRSHSACCDGYYDQDTKRCWTCKEPADNQLEEEKENRGY